MKILLPPSETKREGGVDVPLDLPSLALPGLAPHRAAVLDALVDLAADEQESRRVLKLSERQAGDVAHNRRLRTAPTMPAVDRYTGVLFDALDAPSLSTASRRWLGDHVWIHSAPFGPVGALDPIPTYRLAAGTAPSFVLDLRSEAYVALGPVPDSVPSAYVRVVTEHGRALNHFNKKSKGLLVRALAEDRPRSSSLRGFRTWAQSRGITLRDTDHRGTIELVVAE